jgi:hypothetical protein
MAMLTGGLVCYLVDRFFFFFEQQPKHGPERNHDRIGHRLEIVGQFHEKTL